jgi:UDP-2,3-diacylglucosamine pyrophosphatase LpxH
VLPGTFPVFDAIVISDLHLGSEVCQSRDLAAFLSTLPPTRRLILNGDVFDSLDFRYLPEDHWAILSQLRVLAMQSSVIWIGGNHDGPVTTLASLLGIIVAAEYHFESGRELCLCIHGHIFDDFEVRHPLMTRLADGLYHCLQRLDSDHHLARWSKRTSKTFLRCAEKVRNGAMEHARRQGCTVVMCGHTHSPEYLESSSPKYANSGSWTELPCHYLTVGSGHICLHKYP